MSRRRPGFASRRLRGSGGSWLFLAKCPLALGIVLAVAACSEPLSDAECVRMLEHYTELLIRSDRPSAKAAEREKLKAEVRAKASRDPEFLSCRERVSRRQFDCAISASDVDTAERCLL